MVALKAWGFILANNTSLPYYNIVAMWPCHMILLVIISNNIPPSLPIALTYNLIPDGSSFQYTKPHSSIVENWLSYIVLLKSAPAAILFDGKHSLYHLTAVLIPIY